jgi:hypothetical protein
MGATAAAAGVAVFAAAIAAGTVAVVAGTVALTKYVLTQADAARNAALATESLMLQSPAFAGLDKSIRSVAAQTNLSSAELGDLAKSLNAAGVGADDMGTALLAAARMKVGGGDFEKFLGDIKDGKSDVRAFGVAGEKYAGLVQRKLLGLEQQGATLKRNMGDVFAGVNVDGFLGALDNVVRGFDDSTESGRAMKQAAKDAFQGVVDAAEKAIPVVEAFVIGLEIAVLGLYIAVKPLVRAVGNLLGSSDVTLEDTLNGAAVAGGALGAVVGGIVTAAAGSAAILAAPFLGMAQAAMAAKDAVTSAIDGAIGYVKGKSLYQIGLDLVMGLANGIKAAAAAVIGAISGVVTDAIDTAKTLLDERSPSKVFAKIGTNVGLGFEQGIDDSAPGARSALEGMVSEPDVPAPVAAGSRSASLNMSGATFNFYGVEGADDAEGRFSELLTRALEGNLAAMGAPA